MATEAPAWFVTQYEDRAMHLYQAEGNRLRPTVTAATRVEADKARFMFAGPGTARKIMKGSPAVPMNTGRTNVEVSLETWQAFDEVEEYDLDRMNIAEREVVAQTGAMALGRATDAEIITKLNAGAATSGNNYLANTSTAFGLVEAMTMCQKLQVALKGKWDGKVYCPLPAILWNQLLSFKQVNSADHVGQDLPFVKATDTRFWNGVNWFLFADEFFPVPAANQADVFMWHQSAVGWGNNTDLKADWQWDNRQTCWTVNMRAKGCAVLLQSAGVVRGRFLTNTAITVN